MNVTPLNRLGSGGRARGGLNDLSAVVLDARWQGLLDGAAAACGGPAVFRMRKLVEARDLLALGQLSGRLDVGMLDLADDLRALFTLRVPVARRPTPDGQLLLADRALLALTYPREALSRPMPGPALVVMLAPVDPWYATVALGPVRPVCLAAGNLPAGVRVRDLVLATYGALSGQNVQVDEFDPGGVLNVEAARWWQQNRNRLPLTREPFVAPPVTAAKEKS